MSEHKYALGVVGSGHIAIIIIRRLLESGYLSADRIIASDSRTLRRWFESERRTSGGSETRTSGESETRTSAETGAPDIAVTKDNAEVVRGSRIVMISVTPQQFADAAASIRGATSGDHIFLSLMAGMPTARVAAALGGNARSTLDSSPGAFDSSPGALASGPGTETTLEIDPNRSQESRAPGASQGPIRVMRAMPNLPFGLGCGVTGLFRGEHATLDDMDEIKHLFNAGGVSVMVEDEALMDAVTAVAGSGPAYFYYFVEMLMEAGVAAGLQREDAQVLAAHACVGAGAMMLERGASPRELREAVTSPGGTTEAAMKTLTECKVAEHVTSAVLAAFKRGQELGGLHAGE